MKFYVAVVLTVLFVTSIHSASPKSKGSTKAKDLLAILKKLAEPESQTRSSRTSPVSNSKYCFGEGRNHAVHESFSQIDGCYDCQFDSDCHLSCTPSEKCQEPIEMCKAYDEYFPIKKPIYERSHPNSYGYFDENCQRTNRCDQVPGTTTTIATPEPGSETCEYNGRPYPKEEKLWYMEPDSSCYMYFDGGCGRFSRCELGGGVFYCKFRGRFRKVGEYFDDPDDPLCMIKFSSRCGALTTCI